MTRALVVVATLLLGCQSDAGGVDAGPACWYVGDPYQCNCRTECMPNGVCITQCEQCGLCYRCDSANRTGGACLVGGVPMACIDEQSCPLGTPGE